MACRRYYELSHLTIVQTPSGCLLQSFAHASRKDFRSIPHANLHLGSTISKFVVQCSTFNIKKVMSFIDAYFLISTICYITKNPDRWVRVFKRPEGFSPNWRSKGDEPRASPEHVVSIKQESLSFQTGFTKRKATTYSPT